MAVLPGGAGSGSAPRPPSRLVGLERLSFEPLEVVEALARGPSEVVLRAQGGMARPQGAWWHDGSDVVFERGGTPQPFPPGPGPRWSTSMDRDAQPLTAA